MNREEFIKSVNANRLANKGSWWGWTGSIGNHEVRIKAYGTWVQRLQAGPGKFNDSGPAECSVKVFKEYLASIYDHLA